MAELRHQRSLIHGLPDHVVAEEILPRASSWWNCSSIRAVCKGWRGAIQSSEAPKGMLAAIHKLSHGDGSEFRMGVSVYDPERGSWEQMPPIPGIPCGAPISARVACCGGRLFVIGGRAFPTLAFLDCVFSLDLRAPKRRWRRCASMSRPRSSFACAVVGDSRIVVAGGQGPGEMAMASAEVYDVDRDCWARLPEMNVPRADCTAAILPGGAFLCVIGGYCTLDGGGRYYSQTAAADSLEVIELGSSASSSSSWEYVEDGGEQLLRSCVVACGALQRIQPSELERCVRRCGGDRGRWRSVAGKIMAASGSGGADTSDGDGEEEIDDEEEVMLMGVCDGDDEYSTACRRSMEGGIATILCRKKRGGRGRAAAEEIHLPFDLVPSIAIAVVKP